MAGAYTRSKGQSSNMFFFVSRPMYPMTAEPSQIVIFRGWVTEIVVDILRPSHPPSSAIRGVGPKFLSCGMRSGRPGLSNTAPDIGYVFG